MKKLESKEVNSVVGYIGVHNGYLGDFSYSTHASFYPQYCGLDIDPNEYDGTTRQKFITILTEASTNNQYKILLGVIEKFPLERYGELYDIGAISEREFNLKKELYAKISN
jgi:hypothetical protein